MVESVQVNPICVAEEAVATKLPGVDGAPESVVAVTVTPDERSGVGLLLAPHTRNEYWVAAVSPEIAFVTALPCVALVMTVSEVQFTGAVLPAFQAI